MAKLQRRRSPALQSVVVETVASPEDLRERLGRAHAASILKLGRRLVELDLITPEQLDDALRVQASNPDLRLGRVLTELGYLSEAHLAQAVCDHLDIPLVDLEKFPIDPAVVPLIPAKYARRYNLLPLCRLDGQLCVAMSDPLDTHALDDARFCAQMPVLPVMALRDEMGEAISEVYGSDSIPYVHDRAVVAAGSRESIAPLTEANPAGARPLASTQPDRDTLDASVRRMQTERQIGQAGLLPTVVETVVSPDQLRARLEHSRAGSMRKLGERLVELELLTSRQLGHALDMQRANPGLHLGQAVLQLRLVSEVHLKQVVCEQLGIPLVDLDRFTVDGAVLRFVPERSARRYRMLPLCRIEGQLFIAMADPLDPEARQHAQFCAQMPVAPVMAIRYQVERAIATLYDAPVRVMPSSIRRDQSRHWDVNAALGWC